MQIIIFFLLIAPFVGPYVFIFLPKAHLIRVITPLFILSQNNARFKLSFPLKLAVIYFGIYLIYTLIISLFYYDNIHVSDVLNFILLHGYIASLIIAVLAHPRSFFRTLEIALYCFVFASLAVALYEEINLEHLRYSSMIIEPKYWPDRHMPTTFFTNPNDFAAVYLLTTMWLLSFSLNKARKALKLIVHGFLIATCLWVISVTDAKLNFIAFLIFLIFYFRLWRMARLVKVGVLAAILLVSFIKPLTGYLKTQRTDLFAYQIISGGSIAERIIMTKYGIKSVLDGYSFGFGVNASNSYYKRYVGQGLTGHITDPHNYIIELLINSGLWILLLYLLLNILLFRHLLRRHSPVLLIIQFVLYNFVLLSSSSSLFFVAALFVLYRLHLPER